MPSPISIGTTNISLKLSKQLTQKVNDCWENGEIFEKVSRVTADLLKFWFKEPHIENRIFNFHQGQKQAILNAIYVHEILGVKSVKDIYENIDPDLLRELDINEIGRQKYQIPKYAIKMATGTGKTWVMHALLVWQYLNAKLEEIQSGRYTKNFLLVAPGIIVYERLLDAFLGKENEGGERDFEKSDYYQFQELFIPPQYRNDVFGFIQNSVAQKQEIGSKVTGDGLIAIANWHLFLDREEGDDVEETSSIDDPRRIINDLLPIKPGVSGGNSLDALDATYLRGREIEFLTNLGDLMVINDEAHHIHENKIYGEIKEVEWQKSLNQIAKNKSDRFIQVDFSATPYDVTGSGQNRKKHYFPHIIIDFDLKTAIRSGLVKTIAIDKRKEITDIPLDFRARTEGNQVLGLSDGQKLMLSAGLNKLKILEDNFVEFTKDKDGVSDKYPKMLIMCENTNVSPFVVEHLKSIGLNDDEIIQVDSGKKGDVSEEDWKKLKQQLFNIDKRKNPKIIVSVLMLREGFDVNNICVIIPLRTSSAPILLEQTIGRGLRLMWREPEFKDVKDDNIHRLLIEKKEPSNYLDLLSIVEHPEFMKFYEDLEEGMIAETEITPADRESVLGDIIKVGLKPDYKNYDIYWPIVIKESEEEIKESDIDIGKLESFQSFPLDYLKKLLAKPGEQFVSEELIVHTRFGEYSVDANLFKSQSYNEYLGRIVDALINRIAKIGARKTKMFPTLQINSLQLVRAVDKYIRLGLFGQGFDPFIDNNWKILLANNGVVTDHIIKQVGKIVYEMQQNIEISQAVVEKRYFSEVDSLRMRENYSELIQKTIYERLSYPSNKGGFERDFMMYADQDSKVQKIIKINEYYHNFAHLTYMRNDGFLANYSPDYIIETNDKVYLVELKSEKDLLDGNVQNKRMAALDWVGRINNLDVKDRANKEWQFVLLGENNFYSLSKGGADIDEICQLAKLSKANVEGRVI
mgnify:CR=1 FL=1